MNKLWNQNPHHDMAVLCLRCALGTSAQSDQCCCIEGLEKLKTLPFCDATKPQKPWGCNEDLRWERKIEVAWQAMKWNESEKWTWHSHAFVPIIFFKFTSGNSELSSRINQAWRKKRVCPVGSMTKDVLFMCAVTPGMANPTIHDISKVMDNNKLSVLDHAPCVSILVG